MFTLIALAVLLLAGCRSSGPHFDARQTKPDQLLAMTNLAALTTLNQIPPAWLVAPTNFFTLGPGDRLEIELMDNPQSRATVMVAPDGKIYYYLLPGLDVWGLSLADAKAVIEKAMQDFVRNPVRASVALRSANSKRVWMLGRLGKPGVYSLTTPMTLLEALAAAGGPASPVAPAAATGAQTAPSPLGGSEDVADLDRSFVIREGKLLPLDFRRLLREGDVSQNIYLQPDDFVYLPAAQEREVYVLGAVARPRAVDWVRQLTLVAALAGAGGPVTNAYLSHVAIVRGALTNPKIAIVDFRAIVKGKATDVLLEPRDIVYVPVSPFATLNRYADLILSTFVRTVGANEGARAVSRGAAPIGAIVPIGF